MKMKRTELHKLLNGTRVKLVPQGKVYTLVVYNHGENRYEYALQDSEGKVKSASMFTSVYYCPSPRKVTVIYEMKMYFVRYTDRKKNTRYNRAQFDETVKNLSEVKSWIAQQLDIVLEEN